MADKSFPLVFAIASPSCQKTGIFSPAIYYPGIQTEMMNESLTPVHGGQASEFMTKSFTLCAAGIFLSLSFLCSCATEQSVHRALPADVPINKDAGRGGLLMVTVQLENGRELPMIVDTGAGSTVLDESLKSKLGKPLGTAPMHSVFGISTNNSYTAPKLYLGGAPLMMTGTAIVTWDVKKRLSSPARHPVMGILGIDVLEHYCIQLDFAAGKMRFLDDPHADKSTWGKAFPIVPLLADDPRPAVAENLLGRQGPHSIIDSGFLGDGSLMPKYFQLWTNPAVVPTNGEARSPDGVFGGRKYPFVFLSEKDWPSDAIGLNFLARHLVTFDFPNHTLYLRCRSIGPLPGLRTAQFKPIPDKEPEVTTHVRAVMQDWIDGTEHAEDYTASAWKRLLSKQKDIQTLTTRVGDIVSLTLVERSSVFGWRRSYSYRMEFTSATLLAHFVLNRQNKLASGKMQVVEWKEPVD
jgi:hypothetical protein